jgi:hypothetical protein
MNRREQLIAQLRGALNQLESPPSEETVCFTIAETEFEFEKIALDDYPLVW